MTDLLPIDFLTLLTLLPLLGAVVVFVLPQERKQMARWVALLFSIVVGVLAIGLFISVQQDPPGAGEWAFEHRAEWFPQLNASWHVGVDGLSATMILLTGILVPLAVLIAWETEERVQANLALFLFLETGLLGVFVALDLVIFFVFWEIGLVPMYFLIFLWGGENRRYAANKFFLYTMAGSLGLLLASQFIGWRVGTFDIPALLDEWPRIDFDRIDILGVWPWDTRYFALLGFALAFLIKIPAWPFHTWLPDAHTEAPTGGSMLLAGVLLKLGAYGFLRLAIPLFPDVWVAQRQIAGLPFNLADILAVLAMLGIVLGALAAWGQTDFKRLVAYSSVNHMGFVVLGLAAASLVYGVQWAQANNRPDLIAGAARIEVAEGQSPAALVAEQYPPEVRENDFQNGRTALNGAVLQMFNHGLSSAGMFLLVGALYHKAHTRDLRRFGGLWDIIPIYGGLLIFMSMGSLGLPGLGGFVSEFLVIAGSFPSYPWIVLGSMFGLLITGIYVLKAIQMVLHGPFNEEWAEYDRTHHSLEISVREVIALAPLVALILITGLFPNWVLEVINDGVLRFLALGD